MKRATALLLLLAVLRASPLAAQEPPEVHSIGFSGVNAFGEELLRAAIISNQTSCGFFLLCLLGSGVDRHYVDEVGLRGDLVRLRMFYYQRGYREAKIELDTLRDGDGIDIRFAVKEGRPVVVKSLNISGAQGIAGGLPLVPGEPFSLLSYELARDTLATRLANLGYPRAEVLANYTIPRDSQFDAHVDFEVVPGERMRFGAIAVEGSESVSPYVVLRMLTFGSGDLYNYSAVLKSQRNLFGLEIFRHVDIRADVNAATDSLVPVTVQVSESDLRRLRIGAGMSTAEYINAEGLWTSRNFLGGARRVEARARLYNVFADALHYIPGFEDTSDPYDDLSGLLSLDFSQPWFFDPQNSFNAGVYLERRSLPDIFVRSARGGYLNLTRSLSPGESWTAGYRPELTELTAGGDLVFCVNFVACGADEIRVLRDPHWLSPLTLSYARDRSNSLFAPTSGYIVRFDGEYAANHTGSDFSYSRLIGEITDYSTLAHGVVLAARIRPGWARELGEPGEGLGLHPQKRFFGGGPNSVRGFAQFRMGPKLLTVNASGFLLDHCSAAAINEGSCDVSQLVVDAPSRFEARPVGGAALLEGNLELRMPSLWERLRIAAFVDYGQVWRTASAARLADIVVTPGFGVRYFSAIGPIRVDVGYNPRTAERLPVVTTKVECAAEDACVNTNELVALGTVSWGTVEAWHDRFQLHFSIGQAF